MTEENLRSLILYNPYMWAAYKLGITDTVGGQHDAREDGYDEGYIDGFDAGWKEAIVQ